MIQMAPIARAARLLAAIWAMISILGLSAQAAPVIVRIDLLNACGPPPFDCLAILVYSTQAAGKVLTLEISRDGGATWEWTGSSAGVASADQVSLLTYGVLRFTDDVPVLMFRTVEY